MLQFITDLNFYYRPLLVIILSILLFLSHSYRFKYLLNRGTIYLTLMLPVTILIVTQAISTNLYLSLGLIGALSIVRYRTPVKSQYELSYLFSLIGIGIVTGVNPLYGIILTILIILVPFFFELLSMFIPKISGVDLRLNSSGRAELNLIAAVKDLNNLNLSPNNGKLIRIDQDNKSKEAFILFSFDSLGDAVKFKDSLIFEPLSVSVSNL